MVTVRPYQRGTRVRCVNVNSGGAGPREDGDRTVEPVEDDGHAWPERTGDDTGRGSGDHPDSNDERLLDDRPPHWD